MSNSSSRRASTGTKGTPRVQKLRRRLKSNELDAMLVLDRDNTRYLTGFTGTYSILLVDRERATFITDARYGEAAEKQLGDSHEILVQPTRGVEDFLARLFRERGYKTAGFEGTIPYNRYEQFDRLTGKTELREAGGLVGQLRATKDDGELVAIRRAVRLADRMMRRAIAELQPGLRERDLSRLIRFWAEEMGGSGESFPNIVASGRNSSRPHHHPGTRKMRAGDVVTIDLGAVVDGYCSDLTRTVVLGKPPARFRELYEVCLEANRAAIDAIRPGMTGVEADAVARDIIARAGYGDYFGHGLGHGVGVQIHEGPRLSPAAPPARLKAGNVVTIEPGIYIPGKFGVRIEDYVVLQRDGAEVLSKVPKKLKTIAVQ